MQTKWKKKQRKIQNLRKILLWFCLRAFLYCYFKNHKKDCNKIICVTSFEEDFSYVIYYIRFSFFFFFLPQFVFLPFYFSIFRLRCQIYISSFSLFFSFSFTWLNLRINRNNLCKSFFFSTLYA